MKREPVESSTLKSVGYSRKEKTLQLEFTSGEVYEYFQVPEKLHLELMTAASPGSYFNQQIKDRYDFSRLINNRG